MAKARATCTCATCGKTFEVTAYRQNTREAQRFEQWAETNITECDECKEKRLAEERAIANRQAAESAVEKGWPMLTGTEKQVAWANTIREAWMSDLICKTEVARGSKRFDKETLRVIEIATDNMLANTSASWWIDNRDYLRHRFEILCARIRENPAEFALSKAKEAELKDDAATVAEPANRTHEGIVDITVAENRVRAAYRKDDEFRELVKNLGYKWDSSTWYMEIGVLTGTAQERAAELGNKLLNAGFAIRIQDANTLKDAIEGNYQPMTYRWIAATKDGKFAITWARNDSFYDRARKLPGAKYVSPAIHVPSREYEAVLDFAETFGFRLTPGAQKLVDELHTTSSVVVPGNPKEPEYEERPLSDVLGSSREVIDDLRDD